MTLDLAFLAGQPWMEQASCAQTDPEAFFPDKGGSPAMAKKICQRCPVQAECLAFALEHKERFGIWGGVTERDRRKLTVLPDIDIDLFLDDEDDTDQEPPMTTTAPDLPDWALDVANLLADTEGHPDATVRSIRKIVTQAAVALRTAATAAARPVDGVVPASGKTQQTLRLEALGVSAGQVRAWAIAHGHTVATAGRLRSDILDAYEAGHRQDVA